MVSADFLQFVVTVLCFEYVYSSASARPPRVRATTFTSSICRIYALEFVQYWTLFCTANLSVPNTPYIRFLFVRPRLCPWVSMSPHIRLLSDSASRRTPLSSANSSYCQVCSGLSPPSDSLMPSTLSKRTLVLRRPLLERRGYEGRRGFLKEA